MEDRLDSLERKRVFMDAWGPGPPHSARLPLAPRVGRMTIHQDSQFPGISRHPRFRRGGWRGEGSSSRHLSQATHPGQSRNRPTPKIGAEQHTRPVSVVSHAPAQAHERARAHTRAHTHARTQFLQTSQDRGRRRGCSRDELDELEDAGDAEDAQDLEDADDARVAVRRAVGARVEAVLRRGAAPLGHSRRLRGGGGASGLADFLNLYSFA